MGAEDFFGSMIGSGMSFLGNMMQGDANRDAQRDFAQHGLSWRVEDAKEAGINPLAALGAQLSSFSNTVGAGTGVAEAGQDISRAMHALGDPEQRQVAMMKSKLDLERSGLENDILRNRLASSQKLVSQPGTPPGIQFGPPDKYKPLVDYWRRPDGELVPIINEKATGSYMAGSVVGAGKAINDVEPPFRRDGDWSFQGWKRWLFPNGVPPYGGEPQL